MRDEIDIDGLVAQLSAKRSGTQFIARCPAHDDKDASMRFGISSSGKFLAHCYSGCSFEEIMISMGLSEGFHAKTYRPQKAEDFNRNAQKIRELLCRCAEPLMGGPISEYLESRGIGAVMRDGPAHILSVPDLEYWETGGEMPELLGKYPAMIGVYTDSAGDITSLHRTYLKHDGSGKADVPTPRKMMAASRHNGVRGGSIKIYKAGESLAVAEGIETALAFRLLSGVPTWSCVSAGGMERVEIPRNVRHVYIVADNDKSGTGQHAANKLLQRIKEDHRVTVCTPKSAGTDMLDAYNEITETKPTQKCRHKEIKNAN